VAAVPCPTRPYEGDDPVGFVVSLNLKRRHLSESQRAMVAAKLATLPWGRKKTGKFAALPTQGEAAALLNISERSVRTASEVRGAGSPELVHAVEAGAVSISAASNIASLPVEAQRAILAHADKREVLRAAKAVRAERIAERHAKWTARTIEISNRAAPLPSDRRYPVILADPAWKFEVYDLDSGMERAAEVHYPTWRSKTSVRFRSRTCVRPMRRFFYGRHHRIWRAPGASWRRGASHTSPASSG